MADLVYMARNAWTALLDSIRAKGGTSAPMTAAQAKAAVEAIETGSGGYDLLDIISRTQPAGAVDLTGLTSSGSWFFQNNKSITSIYAPSLTTIIDLGFSNMTNLVEFDLGDANPSTIYTGAFKGCTKLKRFYARKKIWFGDRPQWFQNCTALEKIAFPACTNVSTNATNIFMGCTSLTTVDMGNANRVYTQMFRQASALTTVILRRSNDVVPLYNVSAFESTPFASGGSGGTIYIPKVLYDHLGDGSALDYKAATNWSTVDGYGTVTWAQIEGSYFETHYGDDTEVSA
jgi:hypothetical protein